MSWTATTACGGRLNQPISEERYDALRQRIVDYVNSREVFVQIARRRRLAPSAPVRAYTETAWASIFKTTIYQANRRRPGNFQPNFTIIDAPCSAPTRSATTRSETGSWSTWARRRS